MTLVERYRTKEQKKIDEKYEKERLKEVDDMTRKEINNIMGRINLI